MTEWLAYQKIRGPLGPQREDIMLARLLSELWKIAVPGEAKKIQIEDYLTFERPEPAEPKRQSEEAMIAIAKGLAKRFGSVIERRE